MKRATTLLQCLSSFWMETYHLLPTKKFFVAMLYISPVMVTQSVNKFCRDKRMQGVEAGDERMSLAQE